MSEATRELATYLADHPRMIGVLFALSLLTTETGMVFANNSGGMGGP